MFRHWFNWRTLLSFIAILIVSGTILYSSYVARQIEAEEREKVEEWVEASTSLLNPANTGDTRLHLKIFQNTDDIPIIETDEKDSILTYVNLDTTKLNKDSGYLDEMLQSLKEENEPVIWRDPLDSTQSNRYYFGHSTLQDEIKYFPLLQLLIVGLFITITITALRTSFKSTQNHLWAGMAKETAHQMGTPVSSLEGWVEILKESHGNETFVGEMEKDVSRLRLVSDRFGKIGSTPVLEERDLVSQIRMMVDYMGKRAGGKVRLSVHSEKEIIKAKISAPLFDWVIENLLKNALDAMEGKGTIDVHIKDTGSGAQIDIKDTGKGISAANLGRVFKPGFTTKKRGWGLGLSLSKRIIEQYHEGQIWVKDSEPGKGTTFRIVLKN